MKKNNHNNFKISENYIINKLLINLNFNKKETFNFKNDGAFLKIPNNKQIVVTNDTINESVDFFTTDPADSVANKIICYNLSDISSMGADPYAYTLSLSLPLNIKISWLKKFIKKLYFLQKKYNFFLLGGDLSHSDKIVISSNFFGFVKNGKIIKRTGSSVNDDVWVTGNLGESSLGLSIRKSKIKMNYKDKIFFIKKFLYPTPCMIGEKIINIATSAIDISDGFYGDLENLINENKLGAMIQSNTIPFSNKIKKLINNKHINLDYLLSSGDDYELIFTAHPSKTSIINKISKINNVKITKVGRIIKNRGLFIDGKILKKIKKSFQHFL